MLNRTQQQKLENFEMEKFKALNEDLLNDEQESNLKNQSKKILDEITKLV